MADSPILHVGATVICPHGGQVTISSPQSRVKVNGQPAATLADTDTVAGCPFQIPATPPKPQPCVTVRWLVPAARVRIGGQSALLQSSTGLCLSVEQIPGGPPNVAVVQPRVRGT